MKSGQLKVAPNASAPSRVPRTESIQGAWYNCENSTAQEILKAINATRSVEVRQNKNPIPQKSISAQSASPPYLIKKAGSGTIRTDAVTGVSHVRSVVLRMGR